MGREATIQTDHALLLPHEAEALREPGVLGPAALGDGGLPQPRARDLVRVRQHAREALGGAGADEVPAPVDGAVPGGAGAAAGGDAGLAQPQLRLDLLVDDPVEGALGDAEVAGAEPPEEPPRPLVPHRLPDAVPGVAVAAEGPRRLPVDAAGLGLVVLVVDELRRVVLVKLQARLHEPDRVRHRAGRDARRHGAGEVHDGPLAYYGTGSVSGSALARE